MNEILRDPATILFAALLFVVGSVVFLRIGAFLSLLGGALLVAFWAAGAGIGDFAPNGAVAASGGLSDCVAFVASELGKTAGKIGILIVFGTIIGKATTDSGAAERIVRSCRRAFGEKRTPAALASGAFILSVPVFYDATFYLLLPLAKSAYRVLRRNYVYYLLCVGLAATISHTIVPPTPGPIAVAETLGVPISTSLGIGLLVGACLLPFAIFLAWALDKTLPNPPIDGAVLAEIESGREIASESAPNAVENSDADADLPPLWLAIAPILLPVVLIATAAIVKATPLDAKLAGTTSRNALYFLGDSNVALGIAALVASGTLVFSKKRRTPRSELEKKLNLAISNAGTIVLITAAGGAFGAALRASGIGDRIQELFEASGGLSGGAALTFAFLATALLKTAQGSSTVAMITAASIFASMNLTAETLGCNPGYLGAAIGVGSSVASWMNDSGFCVFSRSSGVREIDCLRVWTLGTAALGVGGFVVVFALSRVLPMI